MFFNSLLTNFAALEVGQHLYWQIGNIRLHGQVFLTSWILLGALLVFISLGTKKWKMILKRFKTCLSSSGIT